VPDRRAHRLARLRPCRAAARRRGRPGRRRGRAARPSAFRADPAGAGLAGAELAMSADGPKAPAPPAISASDPDWGREARTSFWQPSRALLQSIRDYQRHAASRSPLAAAARRLAVLRHRFWSVVTGADIPLNSQVG